MNAVLDFYLTWQCWAGLLISGIATGTIAITLGIEPLGWKTGLMSGLAFTLGAMTVIYTR